MPRDLRDASSDYWTPLAVALRAARWLDELSVRSVVDIGAGPGKFCIAAALAGSCTFVGLERRARLVGIARSLARQFGVRDRVRFVHGTLQADSLPKADAYYLYNPFAEHLLGPGGYLTHDVGLGCERYSIDVRATQDVLQRAALGTIVLTYNGFGGRMPASYERVRLDRELPCVLGMWLKSHASDDGAFLPFDPD